MNSIENRKTEIEHTLEKLELYRQEKINLFDREKADLNFKNRNNGYFILLIFIILFFSSSIFTWLIPYFLIGFLILAVLLLNSTYTPNKIHINAYQRTAKKNLISVLFPTVQYTGDGHHFKQNIKHSLLLENDISIKDHFQGRTKNGYAFQFADVESRSEAGITFKGLFFSIENPDISCEKIVILKKNIAYSRDLNDFTQVNLNGINPQFGAFYAVLCKNKAEAETLLTKDFLKPIHELSQKWNAEIRWSFIGNQIYVAIRMGEDLFTSPSIFHNIQTSNWTKKFCDKAICYIDAIEEISLQLEQIPEKIKIELKDTKIKLLDDNSAYDHLVE